MLRAVQASLEADSMTLSHIVLLLAVLWTRPPSRALRRAAPPVSPPPPPRAAEAVPAAPAAPARPRRLAAGAERRAPHRRPARRGHRAGAGRAGPRALAGATRARWAAWLPEVRFRVDRRFGRSESLDVSPAPLADAPPVVAGYRRRGTLRGARHLGSVAADLQPRRAGRPRRRPADGRRPARGRVGGHPPLLRAPTPQGRGSYRPMATMWLRTCGAKRASRSSRPSSTP